MRKTMVAVAVVLGCGLLGKSLRGAALAVDYSAPYIVIPYTFSVAMWGSQGPAAAALARTLEPQGPIFGVDFVSGMITTAASLAECNKVRAEIKADLGTLRLVTQCHPTTPVVLDGPIR